MYNLGGEMSKFTQGQDLQGWHIEIWYQLIATNAAGKNSVIGYLNNEKLAKAIANKGGSWGVKGKAIQITVITQDGKTGYIIKKKAIHPNHEKLRQEAMQSILPRLDDDEIAILGLEKEIDKLEKD